MHYCFLPAISGEAKFRLVFQPSLQVNGQSKKSGAFNFNYLCARFTCDRFLPSGLFEAVRDMCFMWRNNEYHKNKEMG